MWVSWRPRQSVAITESADGINWNAPQIVLGPRPETGWEDDINRPVVVHRNDGYDMLVYRPGSWNTASDMRHEFADGIVLEGQ